MKKIIKFILIKISRIIYWIIPEEFKRKNQNFRDSLKTLIENKKTEKTYEVFHKHISSSLIFDDVWQIRNYAIKKSLEIEDKKKKDLYYLEFGTWTGGTANYFSKYVDKLYTFDSFEGLKEDWVGTKLSKTYFNLNKKIPNLASNVEIVNGWVEDTLDEFLKKEKPLIQFIHFDIDTYNSTKFVLEKIKPFLNKNSILVFDQFYNYVGWEMGEYKAFMETFSDNEFNYKAFRITGRQVVIEIK